MMYGIQMWMSGLLGLVMIGLLIWLIVKSAASQHSSSLESELNDARESGEQEFEEKRQLLEL